MAHIYVTNHVKKLFIAAFREIFAQDADFTYNKTDAALGKLLISGKYAEPKTENKVPQLIFSTVAYSSSPTTLGGNLHEQILATTVNGVTKNSRTKYSNIVQFTMSVDCVSTVKAEAELLADKVFNALTISECELIAELGPNIRGVQVGEAIPRNQYPQYQFISQIMVQGDFVIQWLMEPSQAHPLLASIKESLLVIEI